MMNNSRVPVILKGSTRTPIGNFLGGLSSLKAPELGAIVLRAAVERARIDVSDIDEVIIGNVVSAGAGQAPARQAAVNGGIPAVVPALTINKVCGSGLKAVMLAAQAVRAGDAQLVIAGGMESMSSVPFYISGLRTGGKFGDKPLEDGLIQDGLWCSFGACHMGGHAEYTAMKAGVSRKDADSFALHSHEKACAAIQDGSFRDEIVPVEVRGRSGVSVVDTDESPRTDTSLEALSRLRPAFVDEAPANVEEHVVTAGNAPGLNDGAAAIVVTSLEYAKAHGLEIDAVISAYASGATEPRDLFFAPIVAVERLLKMQGTAVDDYEIIELNEAFSVQAIANIRGLKLNEERVNVHGGAIALGHPIGASGTRIMVTLLRAMEQCGAATGLATLCLGGGNAVALSLEKV